MLDHFQNPEDLQKLIRFLSSPEGSQKLLDALCEQKIVIDNRKLAEALKLHLELKPFERGDEIIKQGDANSELWLLLIGEATIYVNGLKVATRDARTHVGEMALLDYASGRCASVRADTQVLAGKITDEKFTKIAKRYPMLWKNLAKDLASRLREFNNCIKPPNVPPRLFIGSSQEDVLVADEFKKELSRNHFLDVRMWKSNDVFTVSRTTIENLIDKSESSDFALLILGENDHVLVRGEEKPAPRDNVIFELGLFTGALGRDRTFITIPRGSKTKIPSDIFGITLVEFDIGDPAILSDRIESACKKIRERINELGPKKTIKLD